MHAKSLARWGGCAVAIVTLGVALGCGRQRKAGPITLGRPECPAGRLDIELVDTVEGVPQVRHVNNIPIAGPITNIPEFHDCQRFVNPAGGELKYGPMVAIFAHYRLDSLYSTRQDSAAGEIGEAAAEIYSYDGAYERLFINQGFNCLYLVQLAGGWQAYMTSVGNDEKGCQKPLQRGNSLTVVAKRLVHDDKDIPPVARWDYDTANHQQYIGLRCGGEWCEVGHSGFETSGMYSAARLPDDPVPGFGTIGGSEKARIVRVKGWYDEQYLAEGSTGSLKPTRVRGTAFPHPLLDRMNTEAHFVGGWKPVAYLLMDGDPGETYKSKLNLEQGINKVFYCHGTFLSCGETTTEPPCGVDADHQWWAKIESAVTHEAKYYCVTRRTHPGLEIPGVVRWRWREDDETLWVRCPEGCCAVH